MKKNTKSNEEIMEIAKRLESVVAELKAIGCHGMICMEKDQTEVLMENEDLPKGEPTYKKLTINSFALEKGIKVGSVYFHTYLTKEEAEKELFA